MASVEKHGKKFRGTYTDENGRRRKTRVFPTKRAARQLPKNKRHAFGQEHGAILPLASGPSLSTSRIQIMDGSGCVAKSGQRAMGTGRIGTRSSPSSSTMSSAACARR